MKEYEYDYFWIHFSMFELDEEKLQKETSEELTIQCGSQRSIDSLKNDHLKPQPLECVFEMKLYRFKDYGIGHKLYSPPDIVPFPEIDNAFIN